MEKSIGFWDRFYVLFVTDDATRWKIIGGIIVTGGTIASVDVTFFNSSVDDALLLLSSYVILGYLACIAWYCSFRQPRSSQSRNIEPESFPRRLLLQSVAAIVAFALTLRIPRAEARVIERKLQAASRTPTDLQSSQSAQKVIARAKAADIRIDPSTLERVGTKFVNAIPQNPDALNAATACADYQSFQAPTPVLGPNIVDFQTHYVMHEVNDLPVPTAYNYGRVPGTEGAELHPVGNPDLNKGPFVDSYLLLEGGNFFLDGCYFKNVVMRGVRVVYEGAPIDLVNVTFIACSFDLHNDPKSFRLLRLVVGPGPFTFRLD